MAGKLSENEKRNMECTIHVLPNTHWDREWRFPFQETRMYLVGLMDRLLRILETTPEYPSFNFDSQTIFIEDYLEIKPEQRERVAALIRAKRLLVGPYYTLPEMNVIHGESIVRNLLLGHSIAEEFGHVCKVGYTPTSYGQVSQIAQIYKDFGIDGMIFYRGLHDVEADNEYILEASDGSQILGTRLSPNVGRGAFYLYVERRTMLPDNWYEYKWENGWLPFHLCRAECDHEEEPRLLAAPFTETFNPNPIAGGVRDAMEEALSGATCPVFCLFDGMDSTGPSEFLPRIIEECNKVNPKWKFRISSLPEYLADLQARVDRSRIKVLRGERRRPSHDKSFNAFLKDSMSSRMYLKIRNAEVERALCQWAEPFGVLAERQGMEYPKSAYRLAWRGVLANHSHDSIGGLSPDQIHTDMMGRYDQSFLIAEAWTRKALGTLVTGIDTSDAAPEDVHITVFNPTPTPRTEVVECFVDIPKREPAEDFRAFSMTGPDGQPVAYQTLGREQSYLIATEQNWLPMTFPTWKWKVAFEARDIPALGFATFRVHPEPWPRMHNQGTLTVAPNTMENEFLRVAIESNGTLTVTDRATGEVYRNLNYFEDAGEGGDPWWRWVTPTDRVFNSLGLQAEIVREADGPAMTTFSVRWRWPLPAALTELKMQRTKDERLLTITSFITLKKGVPRIEVKTVVDNTVRDHRLRMMAEAGFKAKTSFSHTQFDVVERETALPDSRSWLEPWTGTNPVNGMHGTASAKRGLAVLGFGLTEYEVADDEIGTVATTLLRTYRYPKMSGLFREDRVERIGNDGSQMLGEQVFRYAFCFFKGDWEKTELLRQMVEFRNPVIPTHHGRHKGEHFGKTQSFLELTPASLVLTTFKKAEKGDTVIARLYNPTSKTVKGTLRSHYAIKKAWTSRLDETRGEPLPVKNKGREIALSVPKKKIVTLELELE